MTQESTTSDSVGLRLILVLPGETELDAQGRITGSLDLPLNGAGIRQVGQSRQDLAGVTFDRVYCGPGEAARQTAEMLASSHRKVRIDEGLANLNYGLWHGRRIDEVRDSQPRVFRQWQEHPESVCPPAGEPIEVARERLTRSMVRILRRHRRGVVAVVIPEPAASLVRQFLADGGELGDLWQSDSRCGSWEALELRTVART